MKIGNKGNNIKQINKQAEYKIGMNNKQYVNGFLQKVLCNMYTTMQLLSYYPVTAFAGRWLWLKMEIEKNP